MMAKDPQLQSWSHEFGDIIMPNQNLSDDDVNAVIAYLKEFQS